MSTFRNVTLARSCATGGACPHESHLLGEGKSIGGTGMNRLKQGLMVVAALFCAVTVATADNRPEELRIGVFTFMSGPAAAYGMPGYNAAELLIEQINADGGIDGVPIQPTFVDEAQGTDGVITEFRRLASDHDVMIAALSSANCLALAPVADQLRQPMLTWNCDTHQLFLNDDYDYVYRANSSTIPEFVSYALYLLEKQPDLKRVAIINPDYAFGHDAAEIFTETLKAFKPDIEVVAELYPRLGASSYNTEISRLASSRADVIFSNLWGADLENFVRQAQQRRLFDRSQVVLALGETILERMGDSLPEGVVVGVLGDGWWQSPTAMANERTQDFVEQYQARYDEYPVFPSFKMANSIIAMKAAYEQAMENNGGNWPSSEELVDAVAELDIETLTGNLRIRDDNDGLVDQIVGVVKHADDRPYPVMGDMVRYSADQVTPPVGADPIEWIQSLDQDFLDALPRPGSYK